MPVDIASGSPKYTEVLCIGLGLSGICLGVQLQRKFGFTDVHFYDRNPSHSGTWWVNRYPGCACDVPAIFYSYSFEPNSSWTRLLPSREEIWRYLDGVVDKYQLRPHMTFLTECESAEWDGTRQKWTVYLRNLTNGEKFVHECRLLFSAVGVLVEPKEPDIPGKESFEGPSFHSARWRDDIDLKSKRVAVLGNGCMYTYNCALDETGQSFQIIPTGSASQMVPEIVSETKTLTQFIHTPHWLVEAENTRYGPVMQWAFRNVPFFSLLSRLKIFLLMEKNEWRLFPGNKTGARLRRATEKKSTEYVFRVAPEKYHDILIPEWEIACKRRVFDTDAAYLKSLHAPNLHLTTDPILEILPHGVRTATTIYPADIIIWATGFHTNNGLGPLRIRGHGGKWLSDHWQKKGGPGAYNNTAVHGYPNFMMIYGPNSTTGYASVLFAIENMVNYSLKVVEPIIRGEALEVEVKEDPENEYLRRLQVASADKVWNGACSNWYVSKDGWNSTLYPWSQFYFLWRSTFPIRRDWTYKFKSPGPRRLRLLRPGLFFVLSVFGAVAAVHGSEWWDKIVEYAGNYLLNGRARLGV